MASGAPRTSRGSARAVDPRTDDLSKGQRLGRYRIEEPVGRGGMGTVYRAYDDSTNRFVALKLLAKDIQVSLRDRFLAECEAEAQIRHEHVMPVYDQGWYTDEQPYFVMELVYEPITLDQVVEEVQRGTLAANFPRIKRWSDYSQLIQDVVLPVIEGIATSNIDYGIQHRDLKPENILVDVRTRRPYVIDFGICRDLGKPNAEEGKIVGTPRFLSPEQAKGTADPTTDVWGLGVLLRYVLSGEPPIRSSSPFRRKEINDRIKALNDAEAKATKKGEEAKARGYAARRAQLEDPLLRTTDDLMKDAREGVYSHIPARTSPGLVAIINKAMHAEPASRYQTASLLAADVRRWLDGGVVQAHVEQGGRGADWDRIVRLFRRHRYRFLGAAAAAVAGLVFGMMMFSRAPEPENYRAADAESALDDVLAELKRDDVSPTVSPTMARISGSLARASLQALDARYGQGPEASALRTRAREASTVFEPGTVRITGWRPRELHAEDLTGELGNQTFKDSVATLPTGWWRIRSRSPAVLDMTVLVRRGKVATLALNKPPERMLIGMMWVAPASGQPGFYASSQLVTNHEYADWLDLGLKPDERRKRLPPEGFRQDPSSPDRWLVQPEFRKRPVTNIRPDDAKAYAAWRSEAEGVALTLPTAAQWTQFAGTSLLTSPGFDTAFPWVGTTHDGTQTSRSASDRSGYTKRGHGTSPFGIKQVFDGPGDIVTTVEGFGVKANGGSLATRAALERTHAKPADERVTAGFRLVIQP